MKPVKVVLCLHFGILIFTVDDVKRENVNFPTRWQLEKPFWTFPFIPGGECCAELPEQHQSSWIFGVYPVLSFVRLWSEGHAEHSQQCLWSEMWSEGLKVAVFPLFHGLFIPGLKLLLLAAGPVRAPALSGALGAALCVCTQGGPRCVRCVHLSIHAVLWGSAMGV